MAYQDELRSEAEAGEIMPKLYMHEPGAPQDVPESEASNAADDDRPSFILDELIARTPWRVR